MRTDILFPVVAIKRGTTAAVAFPRRDDQVFHGVR
jgi:hypothetical protein